MIRALVLHARSPASRTLSYQTGWPRALARSPLFAATLLDVLDRRALPRLAARLLRPPWDVVLLLHSVFSNEQLLAGRLLSTLRRLDVPKVFFIGNEYKSMPDKLAFAEGLDVALLVSQLTSEPALELYRRRLGRPVVGIPNTGLDLELFAPRTSAAERPIDLGYRAFDSPPYLGHRERRAIADAFLAAAPRRGLAVDISLDPADRFTEPEWAAFLNRCKGQLGTEAGGDFFELTDETRDRVNAHLLERPDASFDEIWERYFAGYRDPVSGRALSGRIVEAAGTMTAQILIRGDYGGLFRPDVHYIPLERDFSNLDEALDAFEDERRRVEIAENAYELARTELTWERLTERLHGALREVLA